MYLVEEEGEEAVHVGPQEVRTQSKQPKRETRFGGVSEMNVILYCIKIMLTKFDINLESK